MVPNGRTVILIVQLYPHLALYGMKAFTEIGSKIFAVISLVKMWVKRKCQLLLFVKIPSNIMKVTSTNKCCIKQRGICLVLSLGLACHTSLTALRPFYTGWGLEWQCVMSVKNGPKVPHLKICSCIFSLFAKYTCFYDWMRLGQVWDCTTFFYTAVVKDSKLDTSLILFEYKIY